jgi:TPP-dependent pyruvate/acetoin dehydrogenase alpha subunit
VLVVHEAAGEAIERARSGGGPSLIEADTYRFYNHTGRSENDPRPEAERERWRGRDPITILRSVLEERAILSGEGADRVIEEVQATIEEAVAFADAAPYPEASQLLTDVYSA